MNKKHFLINYIFIPLGILFTVLNAVILFMNSRIETFDLFIAFMLSVQIIISLVILILDLKFQKKAVSLYISLLIFFWGLLAVIVYSMPAFGISEFWPLYVIMAGILLIVSGVYKYRRLKFGFVIPAFTLIGMGGWYMLFSFKVIKISFLTVAAILGPVFMLSVAAFLVLFFLAQQKHKELVIKDDDTGTFDDEDVPLNKIGE
ncbi:MAG: hypothetical protein IJ688_00745 [Treponema sp.]|nr:hypothetical protein [Treponema sp.]